MEYLITWFTDARMYHCFVMAMQLAVTVSEALGWWEKLQELC